MSAFRPGFLGFPKLADGMPAHLGSSLVLLDRRVLNNDLKIDFTSRIDGTYEEYEIHCHDLVPVTDNQDLWLRTFQDGGANPNAGASDYSWASGRFTNASVTVPVGSSADSKITLLVGLSNTGIPQFCVIRFARPSRATIKKLFDCEGAYQAASGGAVKIVSSGYLAVNTLPINGVRLEMSSGGFASGYAYLYAVKTGQYR